MSAATSGEILCQQPTSGIQTNMDDSNMLMLNNDNNNSTEAGGNSETKMEEMRADQSPRGSPCQANEISSGQETPTDADYRKDTVHPSFTPDNDMASKYFHSAFRDISPVLDYKSDKNSFGTYHSDYSAMMSPHHMANLFRPEMFHQEASMSKLLRDMLQNKEKQRFGMDKNQVSPLGADGLIMSKFLQHDSQMFRNGMSDNETSRSPSRDSVNSESESENESNNKAESETENYKDQEKLEDIELAEDSDGDSMKVKRARVENIISNIQSPSKSSTDINMNGQNECKRPKRKQYVPQQHDGANEGSCDEEEPNIKQRKIEHGVIREQLKQMQEQLSQMQKCYMALFDQGTSAQNPNNMISSQFSTVLNQLKDKSKEANDLEGENKAKESNLPNEQGDLDPSHFIKQASKLVLEQELAAKQSSATPSDIASLAKMLKDEIKSNVNSLVDSVVEKFVQKQKVKADKEMQQKQSEPAKEKPKSPSILKESTLDRHPFAPKLNRTKVNDKLQPVFFDHRSAFDLPRPHVPPIYVPPPFFSPTQVQPPHPFYSKPEPEQTEALPLVVSQPKKKRTKVTDTRLSPRAARALLQEGPTSMNGDEKRHLPPPPPLLDPHRPPIMPMSLPTSVAIPNPSLQHSDVLAMYTREHQLFMENAYSGTPNHQHHPGGDQGSPTIGHTPEGLTMQLSKSDLESCYNEHEGTTADGFQITSTLTPMHLRKAKLMFFYVRYPSSAILKIYFPDIKFNKNNTAQLVKWFSNFREFYYIQMEKYARQALAEGVKSPEDIVVNSDSELYRVLNLHYNRNNQIEVPDNFRIVVQATLREFFKSVVGGKDQEQSWKKAIYKVIARLDDQLPEYFKSPNWMEKLNDI